MPPVRCKTNRPGTNELRRVLLKRAPGYVAKESELEHRFSELLDGTDLERPEWQVNLGGEEWVGWQCKHD